MEGNPINNAGNEAGINVVENNDLFRVERNDPTARELRICPEEMHDLFHFNWVVTVPLSRGDFGRLVLAMGSNTSIKKVVFCGFQTFTNRTLDLLNELAEGIANNDVITKVEIQDCKLTNGKFLHLLGQFMHNCTSLKELHIFSCVFEPLNARAFSSFMECCPNSLTMNGIVVGKFGDDLSEQIFLLLADNPCLESLTVWNHEVGAKGCAVLGSLLQNNSLKLKCLSLNFNNICDDAMEFLSQGISSSTTLERLSLQGNNQMTHRGMTSLSKAISRPTCKLSDINLVGCNISDQGIEALSSTLSQLIRLTSLRLSRNQGITSRGWYTFSEALKSKRTNLNILDLSDNNIDGLGMMFLVRGLTSNIVLRDLNLRHNPSISGVGVLTLSHALENSQLVVERIILDRCDLSDDDHHRLFKGLGSNIHLQYLTLGAAHSFLGEHDNLISQSCFARLRKSLCDDSSISSTYFSNHSLRYLAYWNNNEPPSDELEGLLALNGSGDKKSVAAHKVFRHHLAGDFNMQFLNEMGAAMLPRVFSWVGTPLRNDLVSRSTRNTVLFQMIKANPFLLEFHRSERCDGAEKMQISRGSQDSKNAASLRSDIDKLELKLRQKNMEISELIQLSSFDQAKIKSKHNQITILENQLKESKQCYDVLENQLKESKQCFGVLKDQLKESKQCYERLLNWIAAVAIIVSVVMAWWV